MSLIADEGLTPALRLSVPDSAYPLTAHIRGVLAHLVFGFAAAATTLCMDAPGTACPDTGQNSTDRRATNDDRQRLATS